MKLFCNESNKEYEVKSISSFLEGVGNGGRTLTLEDRIVQYNANNQNYTVWDSGKRDVKSGATIIGFHCKKCESQGIESLFEINSSNLFKNSIPCHCSNKIYLSGDHVVEMAKRKINETEVENVNVLGAYIRGKKWIISFICPIHGVYSREYNALKRYGCNCSMCFPSKSGYDKTKLGSLYLLEVQTDFSIVLGYGITNKLNNRLTTHRKNLKDIGYKILSTRVFKGSGTKVLAVENAIKALHKSGLIDCEGFRRESISIDRKEEVLELCKTLKEII